MAKKDKLAKSLALERLRLRFPGIYADYSEGRLGSLRLALQLAGLRPERSRLEKLQHSWTKADGDTRHQFLHWLETEGHLQPASTTAQENNGTKNQSHGLPIANGRYLLAPTIARLEEIMTQRNIKPADIMQEMGFDPNDRSLLKAIVRKTSLRLKLVQALETWLKQQ